MASKVREPMSGVVHCYGCAGEWPWGTATTNTLLNTKPKALAWMREHRSVAGCPGPTEIWDH